MGFTKRRKQPHGFRANLPEKHQTAEQRRDGVAPRWQLPDKHCTAEQLAARKAKRKPKAAKAVA